MIHNSGLYLLDIITNLLDLKKMDFEDSPKLQDININELIKSCIDTMSMAADGKGITLKLEDNTSASITIKGDSLQIKRAINNLLSNSIKFTPKGGNVISVLKDVNGLTVIDIVDDGIGIAEDKIPQLFDEFTKHSTTGTGGEAGTGLGLSIVKKIINKHNGKISVTSEINKGTKFHIEL